MAATKEDIEAATVRTLGDPGNGQGVLVSGGIVLTAAHCIGWSAERGMAPGDRRLVTIEPRYGTRLRLSVLALEPVADVAALGAPDGQVFPDDAEAFEAFCYMTRPVTVRTADVGSEDGPTRVHVLTHHGAWIEGTAARYGEPDTVSVCVKAQSKIEGGTSGGPILDEAGHLVGVVSWGSEDALDGMMPRPHLALPVWVWGRIRAAQR
jgi:hypothetical protein